jgi:hypothetical protein
MNFPSWPSKAEIARIMNPTGGTQTPTPWKSVEDSRVAELMAHAPVFAIQDRHGTTIAEFARKEDRDFAMWWTNTHGGVLAILRQYADSFGFVAMGAENVAVKDFASNQREIAEAWLEFFTSMGRSAQQRNEADGQKQDRD